MKGDENLPLFLLELLFLFNFMSSSLSPANISPLLLLTKQKRTELGGWDEERKRRSRRLEKNKKRRIEAKKVVEGIEKEKDKLTPLREEGLRKEREKKNTQNWWRRGGFVSIQDDHGGCVRRTYTLTSCRYTPPTRAKHQEECLMLMFSISRDTVANQLKLKRERRTRALASFLSRREKRKKGWEEVRRDEEWKRERWEKEWI